MRMSCVAITLALLAPTAWAADAPLEARVARLEKFVGNQSAASLMLQLQRLQQEVQELRGLVELQQYKIDVLTGGRSLPTAGGDQPPPPNPFPETAEPPGPDAEAPPPPAPGLGGSEPANPSARPIEALDLRATGSPGTNVPSLPSPETTAGGEREAYKAAFDLLKERRYTESQAAFRVLLARYPQGQYADSARYWLAESSYTTRDYPTALTEFDALVNQYPQSPKVPGALLKIGYIQYEQQNWPAARAALEEVVKRFPQTTEARLAQSRLERLNKDAH
jgi:tol-pal system protein YbgF